MSSSVKLPASSASENVNVTCDVPPSSSAPAAIATVTVGSAASTATVSLAPTAFRLPAASANAPAATLTEPVPAKPGVVLHVAVQSCAFVVAAIPETSPPSATMSSSVKLPASSASENVNV